MAFFDVVVVDASLRHLDRSFTYTHPEPLDPGALVRVGFHGRLVNAIAVGEAEPFEGARAIKAVRGDGLPAWMIAWAREVSERMLVPFAHVLAAMIPERVASEERRTFERPASLPEVPEDPSPVVRAIAAAGARILWRPGVGADPTAAIVAIVAHELAAGGRVLIVTPEADRSVPLVETLLDTFSGHAAWLGSDTSARLRYRAWLSIRRDACRLAIGGRSAVHAPFTPSLIVVVDDANPAHKEGRAPRIHVPHLARDLAELHGAKLLLIGTPPSLDSRLDADPRVGKLALLADPAGIRPDIRVLEAGGLTPGSATMRLLEAEPRRILILGHRNPRLDQIAERSGRLLERDTVVCTAASDPGVLAAARRADGARVVVTSPVLADAHPIDDIGTLVILDGDAALAAPGFRAAEEVFCTWWRILDASRAPRVLIETADRAHHAIEAFAVLDADRFARREAETRNALGYPPYRTLIRCSVEVNALERVLADLDGHNILGPMEDPLDPTHRIVAIRGDRSLLATLAPVVDRWDRDDVRVRIDVDPWDLVEDKWRS